MKKTKKKVIKKAATKKLTSQDLLNEAIKDYKAGNSDWKKETREEMYGIESNIDALLYEKKYQHISPGYGDYDREDRGDDELILERLTFAAIKKMTGRRHSCDTYYDDAFEGYDCMSEVHKASSKRGW